MFRRYSLDEVKRKVVDALQNTGTGLSGIELADRAGINRMTMTKYLDVMLAMGLIRKKKIGTVNVWFLEKGVADIEFPINYIQAQQKLIDSVLQGNEEEARKIVTTIVSSDVSQVRVLTDVIMPLVNTIAEVYSRGRMDKTERRFMLNISNELLDLVKFSVKPVDSKQNLHAIVVAGSYSSDLLAKSAAICLSILGWNSVYVGNVEDDIDPFFDIDFQRYVSKIWADKHGIMLICICSSSEEGLRFLSSTSASLRGRLKGELSIACVTPKSLHQIAKETSDFAVEELGTLVEWAERKSPS